MSVLIRGMKIPNDCWECPCEIVYPSYGRSVCGITSQFTINNRDTRREDCPLIELPPHGRLIDADTLYRRVKTECNPYGKPTINFDDGNKVMDMIEDTQTIIPAEGEGGGDHAPQV